MIFWNLTIILSSSLLLTLHISSPKHKRAETTTSRKRAFGPGHQTRLRIEPGLIVPTVLLARLNGYGTHWSRLVTDHRSRAGIPTGTKEFGSQGSPLWSRCVSQTGTNALCLYIWHPAPFSHVFFLAWESWCRGALLCFFFICTIGVW